MVNKRLEELNKNNEFKIKQLDVDELNDLNKLLQIADYILCSYEEKKELHSILKNFVDVINESIFSIENIDDKTESTIRLSENSPSDGFNPAFTPEVGNFSDKSEFKFYIEYFSK